MLQLKQIPLNFKTSYCNLKIRGLGGKSVCGFSIILILKGLKESFPFVEQKYKP